MKVILLIILLIFFVACSSNSDSKYLYKKLNDKDLRTNNILDIDTSNLMSMTIEEFELYINEYSKIKPFPNIDN